MEKIKAQYRIDRDTNELYLVYVNQNDRKRWYEAYCLESDNHIEPNMEWLRTRTKPCKANDYAVVTKVLEKYGEISSEMELVDRLPRL